MQAPQSDLIGLSIPTYSDPIPTMYLLAFSPNADKLAWQLQVSSGKVSESFFSKTFPPKNSHQVHVSRTGHSSVLQAFVWRSRCLKQDDPAPKTISLSLTCFPPPQVAEHVLHSVHWVGEYGHGQRSELQLWTIITFSWKHEWPTLLTTLLNLVCTPWPSQV